MSPEERMAMRVKVAEDVLAQLDAGIFQIVGHAYHFDDVEAWPGVKCQVCAVGSMLVARLGRAATREKHGRAAGKETVFRELEDLFTERELGEIENAFMGSSDLNNAPYDRWWRHIGHPDYEGCLRAIMRNIVRNGGTFVAADHLERLPIAPVPELEKSEARQEHPVAGPQAPKARLA